MTTEIYVISGFLGAGKTTLIQKLLQEAFDREKVVLIENDFGEISLDAALLKSGGIEVREINSGCICCSLSGDFINALQELLTQFRPDKVIIEPSGVGKLSDILKACADPRILPLARVKASVTVVDTKRCNRYLENFGEFFEDQIQHADIVLLSRADEFPGRVQAAREMMRELNPHARILSKPWAQIDAEELLCPQVGAEGCGKQPEHPERCKCGCHDGHGGGCHGHGDVDADCGGSCGHDHAAGEVFDTVTIRIDRVFPVSELKARVCEMEKRAQGVVLRAKGIVRGPDGYLNLQYLPGAVEVTPCTATGNALCVIGRDLSRQELCDLFGGV